MHEVIVAKPPRRLKRTLAPEPEVKDFSIMGKMKRLVLSGLILVLWGDFVPCGAATVTVPLDPQPTFALSACWGPGGKLLMPAIRDGVVFVIDPAKGSVDRLARPGLGAREFNRPSRIACYDEGVVLGDNSFHLIWLDASLEPTDGIFLPGNPGTREPNVPLREDLGYIHNFDVIWHDGAVYISGTFRLKGELYKGVGKLLRRPLGVELLQDHYHDNPRWEDFNDYLQFSLRILASTGERLYYLYFDDKPILLDVTSGKPVELPEPLRVHLPSVRALSNAPLAQRTALLFSRVRQFHLPVGIWGWRGSLYLLSWRPRGDGLTWELWRRREDGSWGSPWEVPVEAPDLIVAPGPEAWAFVIKGPRTELGKQEVSAVRTIPAKTVEEASR